MEQILYDAGKKEKKKTKTKKIKQDILKIKHSL
jgi:hypothetical protein